MNKTIIRISVIFLSIIITFLLLELGVRLVYKFRFEPKGSAFISASRIYRLSNDKHLLYELIPKSKARIKGIAYEVNAFGFRDKKYRERKVHEKRIIFVGDSLKDYERSQGFCSFIGISGMFSTKDFETEGHTGFIVESISGIIKHIEFD